MTDRAPPIKETGMGRLAGKVAVVLGAAGQDNMGQVMARRFAEEGATVVVAGRRSEPLEALAAEIGGSAALCDITDKAQVDALAATALERHGRLDVAVNCTGWGLLAKLLDTTEEQLDRISALQFKGPYFFLQTFVGRMAQLGGGSVITLSSASVHAVLHHHAAYIATKAAGEAMVRCFANEFGHRGVKVNALAPGLTESPMTAREMSLPGLRETFVKEYPLGRIGTGLDVANAALWLASDESFMTGEVLQVNGGLTLRRNPSPSEINAALKAGRTAAAG
jgi:NAD(P)-dependent dehydrogenase (short-subunit alcohol dehydrogenase family)